MEMCTGCKRRIDPAFDASVRDRRAQPWHTSCYANRINPGREALIWVVAWPVGLARMIGRRLGWQASTATWAGVAATVALVAVLVLASTASAASAIATGDRAGWLVGEQVWGTPACGEPAIEFNTPEEYQDQFGTGRFEHGEPLAWADATRCVIVINRTLARTLIHTAAKRCHVIAHEWWHLARPGEEHSANPRSIMYGEDNVLEGRERIGRRWGPWVASGAFQPCVEMTRPGVRVG